MIRKHRGDTFIATKALWMGVVVQFFPGDLNAMVVVPFDETRTCSVKDAHLEIVRELLQKSVREIVLAEVLIALMTVLVICVIVYVTIGKSSARQKADEDKKQKNFASLLLSMHGESGHRTYPSVDETAESHAESAEFAHDAATAEMFHTPEQTPEIPRHVVVPADDLLDAVGVPLVEVTILPSEEPFAQLVQGHEIDPREAGPERISVTNGPQ